TQVCTGDPEGADDQVGLGQWERAGAFTEDLDHQARVGDRDLEVVVARQGKAEGVEAGAEVGAGGGGANPPASARGVATAAGSTGMGCMSGMRDSAVSGSLRPWPVTVQTTREPAGRRPSAAVMSRPATPVAEAGSTKTPSRVASNRYAARM